MFISVWQGSFLDLRSLRSYFNIKLLWVCCVVQFQSLKIFETKNKHNIDSYTKSTVIYGYSKPIEQDPYCSRCNPTFHFRHANNLNCDFCGLSNERRPRIFEHARTNDHLCPNRRCFICFIFPKVLQKTRHQFHKERNQKFTQISNNDRFNYCILNIFYFIKESWRRNKK